MNLREAILKTADLIECDPVIWNYDYSFIPPCDTPGCALGLIGMFMGYQEGDCVGVVSRDVLGVDENDFYERMNAVWQSRDWMNDPHIAVDCLRQYADTYHPETYVGIPAEVRAIFERVAA